MFYFTLVRWNSDDLIMDDESEFGGPFADLQELDTAINKRDLDHTTWVYHVTILESTNDGLERVHSETLDEAGAEFEKTLHY